MYIWADKKWQGIIHNEAGALAPCKRQKKLKVEKAETLCTQKFMQIYYC